MNPYGWILPCCTAVRNTVFSAAQYSKTVFGTASSAQYGKHCGHQYLIQHNTVA